MRKEAFIIVCFAILSGCGAEEAAPAADEPADPMEAVFEAASDGDLASAPSGAETQATVDAEVEMASLTASVELIGEPAVEIDACQTLQIPAAPAGNATHAPAVVDLRPKNVDGCAHSDGGVLELRIAARTHTVLRLAGAGIFPHLLQVAPGQGEAEMNPVRLLSEEALLAAYQAGGFEDGKRALVVQTPVDGATVELLVGRIEQGPAPLYLDADGTVTDTESSIAGGWAVFTTVPIGLHEVFMAHDELDCVPASVASWPGNVEGHATVLGLEHHNTHSNAFDCN